jgi:hypothetical protein
MIRQAISKSCNKILRIKLLHYKWWHQTNHDVRFVTYNKIQTNHFEKNTQNGYYPLSYEKAKVSVTVTHVVALTYDSVGVLTTSGSLGSAGIHNLHCCQKKIITIKQKLTTKSQLIAYIDNIMIASFFM